MVKKEYKEKIENYRETKPSQMELFFNNRTGEKQYSNTIELYDTMPKYYFGNQNRIIDETGEYLPILKRKFEHRKSKYSIKVSPAKIDKNGKSIDYYPSQREELVEDILRKLSCEGRGVYLDDNAGMIFSLYEIQKELQNNGHGYNLNEIKESLEICAKCNLEVISENGEISISSPIFPTLGLSSKGERNRKAFIKFSPLVTKAINEKSYRQLNFPRYMEHKKMLSRWIHKKMSHHFTQANSDTVYRIKLTTIVANSGMRLHNQISDSKRQIVSSLKELVNNKVLAVFNSEQHCKILKEGTPKNKITDIVFTLIPHKILIEDIVKANWKRKKIGMLSDINCG